MAKPYFSKEIFSRARHGHDATTKNMGKILVPVNFSVCSLRGMAVAIELAKKMNHSLLLVHVTPLANTAPDSGFMAIDMGLEMQQVKDAGEELKKIALPWEVAMPTGCGIETLSLLGDLATSVAQLVEDHRVDFVVMGTNGTKGTFEKWLGSNTWQVAKALSVPLLAIPESIGGEAFRKVLYATNFESGESKALDWLEEWLNQLDASLTVVHIDTEAGQHVTRTEVNIEERRNNDVAQQIHYLQLTDESAVSGLEHYLQLESYDLLAVTHPKRGFWDELFHKSVTKELLSNASIPILVL